MQSNINFFLDYSDFINQIKYPSMKFKDLEFEEEYDKHRFKKKNVLVLLKITIYFNIFQVGIISVLGFLIDYYAMRPITITMPTSITFLVLCNLPTFIEPLVYFIDKLKILRGFAINILTITAIILYSQEYSNEVYHTATPMFIITTIIYQPISFITALVYSVNWICGVLQVICFNFVIIYGIWMMPGKVYLDKPWFMLMVISSAFSSCITLFYFEYFQRKCIYLKVVAEKQNKNIIKVLDELPAPLIISKQGKVIYENKAFDDISTPVNEIGQVNVSQNYNNSNRSFNNYESNENVQERIQNKLQKIIQKESNNPLYNFVVSNFEFNFPSHFNIFNDAAKVRKHFEISSYSISFPSFK